jgi:tellurite resistance protein TerA
LTKTAPTVSLSKSGGAGGVLRVNLRWTARSASGGTGFFRKAPESIDLDLGCLYEYSDGSKGVVQALGNSFRDQHSMGPQSIVWLDGDDRSGASEGGENLFVNLANPAAIKRILVFCFIYEGTPNWADAGAVVTLFPVAGPQVEIPLDEHDPSARMVAIALLENTGGDVVIRREVRYIQGGQSVLDQLYGWGMNWKAGRK